MRQWWAENAANREPGGHADPATFGLDLDQIRPLFADYIRTCEGLDRALSREETVLAVDLTWCIDPAREQMFAERPDNPEIRDSGELLGVR